jgi:cytidylate kinase
MPATTVTFSIQLGSGGYGIAHRVAEALGFRYYDWEITSEAAQLAGVSPEVVAASERVPSFIERVMRRLASATAISGDETAPSPSIEPPPTMLISAVQGLTSDDYRHFIEKVVLQLAEAGNAVIVGHAGQAILQTKGGVLKVLLYGSPGRRIERFAGEHQVSLEEAATTIKQSDKDRAGLFRKVYHMDWLDAAMYDLAINTDYLPEDFITETVVQAARALP